MKQKMDDQPLEINSKLEQEQQQQQLEQLEQLEQHRQQQRKLEAENQPVLLSLANFAGSTSAHGFSRLVAPTGRASSSLWLLFLLGAYVVLGYHTSTLIGKYVGHQVSTSLVAELDFEYPDIYLCNANPVGYSRITRAIQQTQAYATLYDTDVAAYDAQLKKDVENNKATLAGVGITDAWLSWQSQILTGRINASSAYFDQCRVSQQGSEFTGNYTSAVVYDSDLQPVRSPCLNWTVAKARLQNVSTYAADFVPKLDHSACIYNSSINVTLMKGFLGTSNYLNDYASRVYKGPLCFHNSPTGANGLDVDYCGVPFCNKTHNMLINCSTSITQDVSTTYMGPVQVSKSGKPCLPWIDLLSGRLSSVFANLKGIYQFQVFLPDSEPISTVGSVCRSAAVFYRATANSSWLPLNRLIVDSELGGGGPWCLVEAPRAKNLTMESCTVPDCSTSLKCISGLLHSKYGPQVLSKLVGPSLDTVLLDCAFGNRKCTPADFTAFHHPYYGACYKFNSDTFTQNLSPMQRGFRRLNLKLFADDHDHMGNRRSDTFDAVRAVMGGPYNTAGSEDAGFQLFVMPRGHFPGTPNAIPVHTAAHSTVRMRYSVTKDLTTRGKCHSTNDTMDYNIYSWDPTVPRPRTEQNFTSLDSYFFQFSASNWTFKRNQEACANLAVVETFVRDCGCLPYSLPVPIKYRNLPDCFYLNNSSPDGMALLLTQEDCAVNLFAQMETLTEEKWKSCSANCELPYYAFQMTTQPWPDASHAAYNSTLKSLTSLIGFPKLVSPDEGLAMLYYSYLQGSRLISPVNLSDFGSSLAMREAARSNLAWIAVEAEYPIGSGTNQEDGYTLANLLAELGGILGLYCGVSVLTICELMDLVGRLVHRAATRSLATSSSSSSKRVGPEKLTDSSSSSSV